MAAVEEEITSSGGSAKLRGHFQSAVVMGPSSDSEGAELEVAPGAAVFCSACKKHLNGPTQYQEHLKGNDHRNKMIKLREQGGAAASSASVPAERPEGAGEGQPDEYEGHAKDKGCTVFDGCGQVRAAASGASAPAGQPEGAWEGQPEGCEWQDEAWPLLAWSLEPGCQWQDEAWPLLAWSLEPGCECQDEAWPFLPDSGTSFPPTPDPWCCLPPDFGLWELAGGGGAG